VSSEDQPTPPVASGDTRTLDDRLGTIPPRPGVYLLKDRHGKV